MVIDAQRQYRSIDAAAISTAIERGLTTAPRGFERLTAPAQAGVRVLDLDVDPVSASTQHITIDLSQKTLTYDPSGDVELILDRGAGLPPPLDD